jgi:hypothetical protein
MFASETTNNLIPYFPDFTLQTSEIYIYL